MKSIFIAFAITSISATLALAGSPFSKVEIQELLVGNTYPLGNGDGAMYVMANGKVDVVWKGATETGKWNIKSKGRFCYTIKMFGGTECIAFQKVDKNQFLHVYDGKGREIKFSQVKSGKRF